MSKNNVWMPLYIGDYLADTMHLDGEQHGPYLLLIMHYWRNGPLPDDDRALAAIARVSQTTWSRRMSAVIRPFFSASNGRLFHKRVDAEREHAFSVSAKRQTAANTRHSKPKADAEPVQEPCKTDANALHMDTQRASASPSQSQEERTLTTFGPQQPAAVVPINVRAELFREGLATIQALTGKPEKGVRTFVGKLLKTAGDDAAVVLAIIREAESLKPADPTAWLNAAANARNPKRMSTQEAISLQWALPSVDKLDDHNNAAWLMAQVPGLLQ